MRRRRPSGPLPEMPARLRSFVLEEWAQPDDLGDFGWRRWAAERRYFEARRAWCEENGLDYIAMLRRQRVGRLAALRAEVTAAPGRHR